MASSRCASTPSTCSRRSASPTQCQPTTSGAGPTTATCCITWKRACSARWWCHDHASSKHLNRSAPLGFAGGTAAGFAAGRYGAERARVQQYLVDGHERSEEHTSELQSLMRISYAVFCLKKKKQNHVNT